MGGGFKAGFPVTGEVRAPPAVYATTDTNSFTS